MEDESSKTIVHEDRFQPNLCFVHSLNQIVHSVDKGKIVDHKYYIKNCPKPFVNEIRKQIETSW
jgi:hypothetical protein